jgi:hypothetical protein
MGCVLFQINICERKGEEGRDEEEGRREEGEKERYSLPPIHVVVERTRCFFPEKAVTGKSIFVL